jgi:hypothetical protein
MKKQLLHPVDFEIQNQSAITGIALLWKLNYFHCYRTCQNSDSFTKAKLTNSNQLTSQVKTQQILT